MTEPYQQQDDHCPDNVKFPDISLAACSTPAHVKCYTYHASTSAIVSVGAGMQQCMIRNQNEMHTFSKVKNGCKYAVSNKQF